MLSFENPELTSNSLEKGFVKEHKRGFIYYFIAYTTMGITYFTILGLICYIQYTIISIQTNDRDAHSLGYVN